MKDFLIKTPLRTGTKFVVSDDVRDNVYGPGSTGFISYTRSLDDNYQNIARVVAVMTRRGKGGKPRMDTPTLFLPIFFIRKNEVFMKVMPDSSRKYFIIPKRMEEGPVSVMECDPLDFLGWSLSQSMRLRNMLENCRHGRWPGSGGNPLNAVLRMAERFEGESDKYLSEFTAPGFRTAFITAMREFDSSMVRIKMEFELRAVKVRHNAAEFLAYTNRGDFLKDSGDGPTENEYKFTEDQKALDVNFKLLDKQKKEAEKVIKSKKTKRDKKSAGYTPDLPD